MEDLELHRFYAREDLEKLAKDNNMFIYINDSKTRLYFEKKETDIGVIESLFYNIDTCRYPFGSNEKEYYVMLLSRECLV